MGTPNLALRGSTYWWRRTLLISGHRLPLALSLRTGNFYQARVMAGRLTAAVETLRMAYGERGTAVDPATLKKIFSDAMRWQLERIMQDQVGSTADPLAHMRVNLVWKEMWDILARPDGHWTKADDHRLAEDGWPEPARREVEKLWQQHREGPNVSRRQLDLYQDRFGFSPTSGNLDRVRKTIFAARAAACDEAINRLVENEAGVEDWAADALADEAPLAFEAVDVPPAATATVSPAEIEATSMAGIGSVAPMPAPLAPPALTAASGRPKKLLVDAKDECVAAYRQHNAWSRDTIEQVETAIRLFDFAAGGNVAIDDLDQSHVVLFFALCDRLPNRWGKSRDEIERGLVASVERGDKFIAAGQAELVGFKQKTLNKHVTWITAILNHADDNGAEDGHRPALPLRWKSPRTTIGAKKQDAMKRSRDLRSNWTTKEVSRLLEAPIWWGCAGIDRRFQTGTQIIHDGWYWLPLMYILYGGRSSELAGLPLVDVFEKDEIPFFKIDYNDLRGLKNPQSIRRLPIHPELIRLGFISYVKALRGLDHRLLFPEMHSENSKAFSSTFYKSVFLHWRKWGFPDGTEWRHRDKGQIKDKDVHSFRGLAISLMKGKVADSVRADILGHEHDGTTSKHYEDEAALDEKLKALELLNPLTSHLSPHPLQLRPADRQRFGAKRVGKEPDA